MPDPGKNACAIDDLWVCGYNMVNAVKVFTLRLCISAYYIHFKRVKVKIFTAFTIEMKKQRDAAPVPAYASIDMRPTVTAGQRSSYKVKNTR